MLSIMALEDHGINPGDGDILVTGASGGVGSVAVAILNRLGHRVVATTGRMNEKDFLMGLGAADVLDRADFAEKARPLGKELWSRGDRRCRWQYACQRSQSAQVWWCGSHMWFGRVDEPADYGGAVYTSWYLNVWYRFGKCTDLKAQNRLAATGFRS